MRPLGRPLTQLALVLARANSPSTAADLLDPQRRRSDTNVAEPAETRLSRSSLGLVELLRELANGDAARLLIIVDQFEELFRYSTPARSDKDFDERALFVKHLLRAATDPTLQIYVLITMRSVYGRLRAVSWSSRGDQR